MSGANKVDQKFKISSSDKKELQISSSALKQCEYLKDLVNNLNYKQENVEIKEPIPVSNVDGKTLNEIFKWCEYHRNDAPHQVAPETVQGPINLPSWDKEFLDALDDKMLFDLICAAHSLRIELLLDYGCEKVASMMRGKTPEEMRIMFGIATDEEEVNVISQARTESKAGAAKKGDPTNARVTRASARNNKGNVM